MAADGRSESVFDEDRLAAKRPGLAAIWIHGYPARSWDQVVKYLSGDAHDMSKVQVRVGGRFYDLILGEDDERI